MCSSRACCVFTPTTISIILASLTIGDQIEGGERSVKYCWVFLGREKHICRLARSLHGPGYRHSSVFTNQINNEKHEKTRRVCIVPGQGLSLQAFVTLGFPIQSKPPGFGGGLLHVLYRDLTPPLQFLEHGFHHDQSLQPAAGIPVDLEV